MKASKKIISILLTLILVFSMSTVVLGTVANAAYENTYSLTGNQRNDIIGVAKTQIGYREGSNNNNKYGSYCGGNNAPWCAYFIVWCARQAGISSSIIKTTGWACADDLGVKFYSRGSYTPKKGDLIFFDYASTKATWDHVGLVESVSSSSVTVIEGNSNDRVERNSYSINYSAIKGYGVPSYKTTHSHSYSRFYTTSHPHQIKMKCGCGDYYYLNEYKKNVSGCSKCSAHTHNYTNGAKLYESQHPHRISQRCQDYAKCGGYRWLDEYKKVSDCPDCYSYFSTNFTVKSANYIQAYSNSSCTTKAGTIYSGDILNIKRLYQKTQIAYAKCNWDNADGYKYIYFKIPDLKIRMTKYVNAYSEIGLNNYCGRAFTNDIITSVKIQKKSSNIIISGYCAWNGSGNKYIYMNSANF